MLSEMKNLWSYFYSDMEFMRICIYKRVGKWVFWSKRGVSLALIIFLVPLRISIAGENIKWHGAGLELTASIENVFLEYGVCESHNDCTKRNLVFFRSVDDGLDVSLYNIRDTSIIASVLGRCAKILAVQHIPSISIRVFRLSKQEELKRAGIFGEKVADKYIIEGKYAESNNSN